MTLFESFLWRVPTEFHDAIAQCLFGEGDVLYRDERCQSTIQVRYPKRENAAPRDARSAVFAANWSSACVIDLYTGFPPVFRESIHTTQGRLYSALWHDDLSILRLEESEPPVPQGAREIHKSLKAVPESTFRVSHSQAVFVMPTDVSNDLYRRKKALLIQSLGETLIEEPVFFAAEHLPSIDTGEFVPTTGVYVFPTRTTTTDLQERVRAALYAPGPKTTNPNFRLSAHGIILQP